MEDADTTPTLDETVRPVTPESDDIPEMLDPEIVTEETDESEKSIAGEMKSVVFGEGKVQVHAEDLMDSEMNVKEVKGSAPVGSYEYAIKQGALPEEAAHYVLEFAAELKAREEASRPKRCYTLGILRRGAEETYPVGADITGHFGQADLDRFVADGHAEYR